MRKQVLVPLVASLLVLAATPCFAHAGGPKACELLAAQTAASLLGTAVGSPTDMNGRTCAYLAQSGGASVVLGIADSPDADSARAIQLLQATASQQQGTTTKPIPGLGEQSFLATRTSDKNALVLVYHQKMLTLAVKRPMTPALETAMVEALRQAMSRL